MYMTNLELEFWGQMTEEQRKNFMIARKINIGKPLPPHIKAIKTYRLKDTNGYINWLENIKNNV